MTAIELDSLVDCQQSPFLVIDKDFKIVSVNRAFEEAYDTTRDQVIGRRCYEVSHGHSTPCYEMGEDCPHMRVFKGEALCPHSCLHVHHDSRGRLHQVRLVAYPLRSSDGQLLMGEAVHELSVLDADDAGPHMVGQSPAFLEAVERLHLAAKSDVPVLLTGETGTGKELAANFVHRHSARAKQPFFTLDCTVLAEGLFESEVFGSERGAFTGSVRERKGLFELSDGGTLFLDEIGELSLPMQSKLLRVLETGQFRRVGGRQMLHADARVVCATNRRLEERMRRGEFREDLYYRITGLSIHLPSLRERLSDIAELAASLLQRNNQSKGRPYRLTDAAIDLLQRYDYPGNVRELRNILYAATTHSPNGRVDVSQVVKALAMARSRPAMESETERPTEVASAPAGGTLNDVEAQHIRRLLKEYHGNRRKVAAALGVSERTLYRKLKRYNLNNTPAP